VQRAAHPVFARRHHILSHAGDRIAIARGFGMLHVSASKPFSIAATLRAR
jgi:hypothetical protein